MPFKFKSNFAVSGFTKGVAMLAGGSAIGQILGIVMMPIFTRLYTPADFGGLAVYSAMLGIIVVIASLRYELAIPQAKNDTSAANIVFLSLFIVFILSIILAIGVLIWGDDLLVLLENDSLTKYLWLLPISFFLVGLHSTLNYWLIRTKAYSIITHTTILQSLGQVATRLFFGINEPGVLGLIVANIVSQCAGLTIMIKQFFKFITKQKPRISFVKIQLLSLRYIRFPKFMVPSSLMNSCSLHFPALIIAALYGSENAGYYLVAQNILGIPLILIGHSVSHVFHGEAAELSRTKPETLLPLFYAVSKKLFFVGLLPVILLITLGEQAFSFFLGENWGKAGEFSAILSFMFLLRFVFMPVSNIAFIIEQQHISVIFQALLLSGAIISLFGATQLGATINEAILLFSITMGFCYLLMYLINLYHLKKFVRNG